MIQLNGVSYTYSQYNKQYALKNIDFVLGDNDFVGVIGHTGSGKSTLSQILAGLIAPTSGTVSVDGVISKGAKVHKGKVGLVFQYPEHQLFEETVYRDIAFGPRNLGLGKSEIDARVRESAEIVGLKERHLEKSPFELSGGQKRRVAIAGVLAMRPKHIILDEPTAGLDPKGRTSLMEKIRSLHDNSGVSVLIVSHSMEEIYKTVDRVLVLKAGEIYMQGPKSDIFMRNEELESIGLSAPSISRVFALLRQANIPVKEAFSVEDAKEAICKLYGDAHA